MDEVNTHASERYTSDRHSNSSPNQLDTQIIANGGAREMHGEAARREFVELVQRLLPHAEVAFTEEGSDVAQLVNDAMKRKCTLIAAAGGDGTINAVASALVGTDIVLGVLPMGTLNHFSRDAGIPQDIEGALSTLQTGRVDTIDVGTVNKRCFLNNSGLGLYPDMVHHREQRQRQGLSKWSAMLVESARAFARYRRLGLKITIEGKAILRRTPAVFVGNNEYSLEGALATERATLKDGQLCLYIPRARSRRGLLWFSLRAFFGSPKADETFDKFLTREFSIHSRSKHLRVSIDGEVVMMHTPLEYSIRPRSLRVMVSA